MNYYEEIKQKLIDNEIYSKVKDYSKEISKLTTYFEIGELLYKAGNRYGSNIIEKYSKKLVIEVGKKYDRTMLSRMRQLYLLFNNKKVAPLVQQLTWSHCLILLPIKDITKVNYYIYQTYSKNLSKRELQNAIKNREYERLSQATKLKFIYNEKPKVQDLIKNPITIKNKNHYEIISEKILQKIILEDIETFMKELGNSFSFIGSEYKIKLGNTYNYIDLLLFNYEYNCFVVVELKVTKLKKEHIGQIQIYMNYIDNNIKKNTHNKTTGIIICKQNNRYIIKYCSNTKIISREYKIL